MNSAAGLEHSLPTFEVEIERLLPGGVGLAHAEGLTLFVSLAAPGDILRVQIDRLQPADVHAHSNMRQTLHRFV